MEKKILALLLVAVLGGTSLLPVNAMETSEKVVVGGSQQDGKNGTVAEGTQEKEDSQQSQQVLEDEKEGTSEETSEQKEEGTGEGSEPAGEISDDQKGPEPSGGSNAAGAGNVDEGQRDSGSGEEENEGTENVEEGNEWRIDKTQIELQTGETGYFCVSGLAESADRPQVVASDASGVSVSETTQSEAGSEMTEETPSDGYWYEVTGLRSGDYVISVTVQDVTREIAVHITDPAEPEDEETIEPEEGTGEKNEILEQADQAALQAENKAVEQGWSEDGLYYRNEVGELCKGIAEIEGVLYYFDETTGKLCQEAQWITKEGEQYFCNAEGILYSNQFIKFGTTYYYMGADGSVQKGFVTTEDGAKYYADEESGAIQKSTWIKEGDKSYFADGTGKLYSNQFIKFGTTQYYMGSDGSVQKGLVTTGDGAKYYADEESGVIQKSTWIKEGDKSYFADGTGKLYSNQFIKFGDTYYYMGSDASVQKGIVKASDGKYYYTAEDTGILQKKAGWIEKDDKSYFADGTGKLYSNQFIKFGDTYYYCGSDAALIKDQVYPVKGVLYKFDLEGIMIKESGWGSYGENKYYKNPATGFPYVGWVTFGSTWYYANSSGLMVKGWQYIGGEYYYFYPSTNIMARNTVIDGYAIGADGVSVDKALKDKIEMIKKYEGYPYAIGGNTPNGWDCSGFVQWIYKNIFGITLPRTTYYQAQQGLAISIHDKSLWQPGDLIFFSSGTMSHVGIYLGDNLMIHALGKKYGTRIDDVIWYDNWDHGVWLAAVRRII